MEEERPVSAKKTKKIRITCNVAFTKYEVVRHVAKNVFGWRLSDEEEDEDWDILWTDNAVPPERLAKMKLYQKINHFPGMYAISRKNYLAYNLTKLKKRFPEEYNFFPRTWVVPCDMGDLRNFMQSKKNAYVIVKPEASCQGRGIFLTKKLEDIEATEKHVVQEYISRPFLIDDLKFDLRIYVLVAGCDPLRLYIHEEGLTRFATEEYEKPNQENVEDICMHLTNYAVNKNNPNFVHNENSEDDDVGHKRSLQSTYDYLEENDYDVPALKAKIDDMIIKTLCSIQPNLAHHYRSCQPEDITNGMCFEVLGFDVLIDSKLNPYVLEVNHTPSFTTDSPLDKKVKRAVIGQALKLMNITARSRKEYFKKQKEDIQRRALSGKMERDTKETRIEKANQHQIKRDKWESKHIGEYRKIYPIEGSEKYDCMIKAADDIWQEWTGTTKVTRVRKPEETKEPILKPTPKPPRTETKRYTQKISELQPPHRCPSAVLQNLESPSIGSLEDSDKKNSLKVFDRLSRPVARKFKGSVATQLPPVIYYDDSKLANEVEKKGFINSPPLIESVRHVNMNLVNSILAIQSEFKNKKSDAKSKFIRHKPHQYVKAASTREIHTFDELYKTVKPKLVGFENFMSDKFRESSRKWNL